MFLFVTSFCRQSAYLFHLFQGFPQSEHLFGLYCTNCFDVPLTVILSRRFIQFWSVLTYIILWRWHRKFLGKIYIIMYFLLFWVHDIFVSISRNFYRIHCSTSHRILNCVLKCNKLISCQSIIKLYFVNSTSVRLVSKHFNF